MDKREWQMLEYEIMKATVDICEKHGLTYFICDGTLLGAIRHKGFIPWDDDVDIQMPAKDYKKFCKIAPKELASKGLFVQNHHTEPQYDAMWGRVRANGTTSMPVSMKNWKIHWGATIDIFPIIGVYNNKILKKLQYVLFAVNRDLLSIDRCKALDEKLNKRQLIFRIIPRKLRHIMVDINNVFIDRDYRKEEVVAEKWFKIAASYKSENFAETIKLQFEDRLFDAPAKYDETLTQIYGDYMTPPPIKERRGHELQQGDSIFDPNTDYHEYI